MGDAEAPAVTAEVPEAKEKKGKTPKEKKPREAKSAPSHPPYFQMIKEAITSLKEKNGSSSYAIAKYIESKHKAVLPSNYKKRLALQLKNFAAKGKLTKVKASFKLTVEPTTVKKKPANPVKKPAKPAALKPKPATKKARSGSAKKPTKKPAAKKAAKKKATAPKPKSVKSPAAKKARKAA